jgi:hypothetical protein
MDTLTKSGLDQAIIDAVARGAVSGDLCGHAGPA